MEYREFGKTGILLSGLGFGMNRFEVYSEQEEGFQKAVDVVKYAIEKGINYIDVAKNYSNQMAFPILREALRQIPGSKEVHICLKMMLYHTDKTKEGALRSIREQLDAIGIPKADFCFAQAIKSYDEYKIIIGKGGIYEGLVEAKKQGLIRYICFSSHASVEDTIKIMEEGLFDGITISYHLLNSVQMTPVLEKAGELNMGVLTMNSLAGGLIPQNPHLFHENSVEKVCKRAIQYIYYHREVTCVLSGMQSKEEVDCNISAVSEWFESEKEIEENFLLDVFSKNGLCTGCNYCQGCPKGIPIKELMYSSNVLQFNNQIYEKQYHRYEPELLDFIRMTQELMQKGINFPMDTHNPCIECKSCERKCTQSLPITTRIQNIYQMLNQSILSRTNLRNRLIEFGLQKYTTVAFYPNCASTKVVLTEFKDYFGEIPFRIYIIDRNKELWGMITLDGVPVTIIGIDDLEKERPECIILTHYMLSDRLYDNVAEYEKQGIEIKHLYQEKDVPLVYLGG